jgi:hypothetical protein
MVGGESPGGTGSIGGTGRDLGLAGAIGWGTGKACGTVTGCENPDDRSSWDWLDRGAMAATLCASATSSPVLKADVGVGGDSAFFGVAGSTGSCTVGPVESLGGAGGGTLR